jgi:membrane protease YdiL (CAAX protease family)
MLFTILGILPVLLIRLPVDNLSEHINEFVKFRLDWLLWIFIGGLWGVLYEEILFRGVLWMILRDRGYSETKILVVQAALFWLAHLNLISRSSFWVILPLFSLWLGFLVLRSKSLTPSTWVHFIYNLSVNLFRGI